MQGHCKGRTIAGRLGGRPSVASYLNGGEWHVVAEFTEVESGRCGDRPQLERALATARLHRVPLVVAKVDRSTRSVGFLSRLLEAGVDVRFADLPAIEGPTGRFMLQQMAAVAELEAGLISSRTKAALAAARSRGKRLGGNRGISPSDVAREAGRTAQANRAADRAADVAPLIDELRKAGISSLGAIARALTERGIPTSRGQRNWTATQVARTLAKLGPEP